jgi:hypothetical protein
MPAGPTGSCIDRDTLFSSRLDTASSGLKCVLQIENGSDFDVHPSVKRFVATHRALPIASIAKVENWFISLDDIKAPCNNLEDSEAYQATYHGAEVSVARHQSTSRDNREAHCLQTEIRAMAQLRHPNIISFLGANICSDTWTVVTERMPHGSVRSLFLSKQAQRAAWRPSTDQALAWALARRHLHASQ